MRYIIVGCGAEGLSAAKEIRDSDAKNEVVLISDEVNPFYIRPAICDFLSGELKEDDLFFKSESVSEGITVISGKKVLKVLPDENAVVLSDGKKEKYNFLLLATGGKQKFPQKLLVHREKVFTLKTFADAYRLKERVQNALRILVFGGGYIGVELLRALKRQEVEIIYLSKSGLFWPSGLTDISEKEVEKKLRDEGISVFPDEGINDIIDSNGKEYLVFTDEGKEIKCQFIGVALGLEPDTDFLTGSGIKCDKGILVSEELRTNIANIYAAGDVAQVYDINKKINRINFGWHSASVQGKTAGQNMAGGNVVYISDEDKFFHKLYGKRLAERW